jgi:hypothetical protein
VFSKTTWSSKMRLNKQFKIYSKTQMLSAPLFKQHTTKRIFLENSMMFKKSEDKR